MNKIDKCVEYFKPVIDILPDTAWVAGGAIRSYFEYDNANWIPDVSSNLWVNDIDIFCKDKRTFNQVTNIITSGKLTNVNHVVYSNKNAVRYHFWKRDIEIIKRFFDSPQSTIDNFDFTVCSAAISKHGLIAHKDFIKDITHRKIKFNTVKYPIATLKRVRKYITKGYGIDKSDLKWLLNRVRKSKHSAKNELQFYTDFMITRKLDDYRYDESKGDVWHIVEARQPKDYNPKRDSITYLIESNKKGVFLKDGKRINWFRYKRISKLKAKLLW